jgi:U3 small nucleolar RNA-associated protein 7
LINFKLSKMSFDQKIKEKINKVERINRTLDREGKRSMRYLEQENEGYMIPEEGEKTLRVSQDYLKENMPKFNSDNIFDLELNNGPYYVDFTANGSQLLLAGEKGHVSLLDWRNKDLQCEFNTNEQIRAAKFLHNETMLAVAQKKRLYIYDRQGIELHSLDYHEHPKYLEFLPYHFLLVSGLKNK